MSFFEKSHIPAIRKTGFSHRWALRALSNLHDFKMLLKFGICKKRAPYHNNMTPEQRETLMFFACNYAKKVRKSADF